MVIIYKEYTNKLRGLEYVLYLIFVSKLSKKIVQYKKICSCLELPQASINGNFVILKNLNIIEGIWNRHKIYYNFGNKEKIKIVGLFLEEK